MMTIAIYPGSFKRFFYVREIDHVKATFGDWACQCVSFDFIRLKVPYERENDLINFFSKIGRSIKYRASKDAGWVTKLYRKPELSGSR